MVPFKLKLNAGESIFDQVCFAATRSILAGELKAGEPFPSVRTLAVDLKIHPNTAHKVIQHLVQERWLVVQPGLGTVVAQAPKARAADRRRLLEEEVEKLVVEALRVGASLLEVQQAVEHAWRELRGLKSVANERPAP